MDSLAELTTTNSHSVTYTENEYQISEFELVNQYRDSLIRMLRRLTRDEDRAEDLAHDTLLIVLRKLREGGIRDPQKLSSYVFSTARFQFFGWLRRKDNNIETIDNIEQIESNSLSVEDSVQLKEQQRQLRAAIRNLTVERDKEILTRHYLLDQEKKEICDALSLTLDHYDRVISRARKRLQTHLIIQNNQINSKRGAVD